MYENKKVSISYNELNIAGSGSAVILLGVSAPYNYAGSYFGIVHKGEEGVNQDFIKDIVAQNIEATIIQGTSIDITYKYNSQQKILISILILS